MRIMTILGSPRKHGNTAAVLGQLEALARDGNNIHRINITDHDVRGCLGCDSCQRVMDEPGCCQKDDVPRILQQIIESDLVIYATPLYCWDFSAQMKALMDRHYCLAKSQDDDPIPLFPGKKAALLVTCGGGIEDNADVIQVVFQREMDYIGWPVAGMYILPDCTTPRELGDRAEIIARRMAADLLGD